MNQEINKTGSPRSQGRQTLLTIFSDYIFTDGQNIYNRIVLMDSKRIHTRKLGPTANSQVPDATGTLEVVSPLQLVWKLTKYIKITP